MTLGGEPRHWRHGIADFFPSIYLPLRSTMRCSRAALTWCCAGDPLDKSVVLTPLAIAEPQALSRELMVKTRRRKVAWVGVLRATWRAGCPVAARVLPERARALRGRRQKLYSKQ